MAKVDPKFLSVAIGSRLVGENWKNFDFKSTKLLNMAKSLAPAYFRLGGTSADLLYFKKHQKKANKGRRSPALLFIERSFVQR